MILECSPADFDCMTLVYRSLLPTLPGLSSAPAHIWDFSEELIWQSTLGDSRFERFQRPEGVPNFPDAVRYYPSANRFETFNNFCSFWSIQKVGCNGTKKG